MTNTFKERLLASVTGLLFLLFIVQHLSAYTTPYPLSYWQAEFNVSQVVLGGKAIHELSDSQLYAIVGYKYLHGDDPVRLHPEVPPLGKLIIGFSLLFFNNSNIIILFLGVICLVLVYQISTQITNPTGALFAVLFTLIDPQFQIAITDSYLDIPLLFFILLAVYTFSLGLKNQRWFILSSLSLGFAMATKFYLTGLLLLFVLLFIAIIVNNFKLFIYFIISLPLVGLGYALPYGQSFIHGLSLIDFFHFQRWLTSWWAGNAKVPWGGIVPLIFFGRWATWWGNKTFINIPDWSLLWPISTISAVLNFIYIKNNLLLLIQFWFITYLGFLTVTSPFPRYMVTLMPFGYILLVHLLTKICLPPQFQR